MASISKKGNGFLVRVYVDGKQVKLYGFTNKREAERTGDKIDMLVAAKKTGDMPPDLSVWVSRLAESDSALHAKLARLGLVEPAAGRHTLGELVEQYRKSRNDATQATTDVYRKAEANLFEFFGEACELGKITLKRADDFARWLRSEPLNRRKTEAEPYSHATANKRIGFTKQLFRYAKRVGWAAENPFELVKAGESTNPGRWVYVEAETVETVISASCLPKWRAIMALGRFSGVRGSSELFGLLWEHVIWSSEGEPGQILIKAEKNKRHGRRFRSVPLHPVAEQALSALFHSSPEGQTHVFPGMAKKTNFCTMVQKQVTTAGLPVWTNIWYNLRKSFCSDLMAAGVDPTVYEAITDHSYAIAMKHYQIPHTKRLQKGYESVLESWGLKKGLAGGLKEGLHCTASDSVLSQRDSQEPIFSDSTCPQKNACGFTQTFETEDMGFEPTTPYGAPHFQ